MEENNGIFLVGCDALVYLAEPVHKKYSATFVWGHQFSTYVSYDRFFNLSPQPHLYTFSMARLHCPTCLRTLSTDGLFLNQKNK